MFARRNQNANDVRERKTDLRGTVVASGISGIINVFAVLSIFKEILIKYIHERNKNMWYFCNKEIHVVLNAVNSRSLKFYIINIEYVYYKVYY